MGRSIIDSCEQNPLVSNTVLVIGDDYGTLKLVKITLDEAGIPYRAAKSSATGLMLIEEHRPDLVVLAFEKAIVLEVIGQVLGKCPLVFPILERGKHPDTDRIDMLKALATDCMTNMAMDEFLARIRAILRRVNQGRVEKPIAVSGNLEVHATMAFLNGKPLLLTRTTFELLLCFARNAGRIMSSGEILNRTWGPEYVGDIQFLRVWISRLRALIEPEEFAKPSDERRFSKIITHPSRPGYPGGYEFRVADPQPQANQVAELEAVLSY